MRPRILAFAYSILPGEGSESGSGWVWSRMLAGIGDTWVVTRPFPGWKELQVPALAKLPECERATLVYVDIPAWARRIGRPGSELFARVEYLIWQVVALREARRLNATSRFDIAWHLVYANAWIGSLASLVGPPFVYGPVGGGVHPPWRLVASLGLRGAGYEVLRAVARWAGRHLNPVAAVSWRRSRLILVQNRETRHWLPAAERHKAHVFPNAVLEENVGAPPAPRHGRKLTALFAGRLLPLKGVSLAIDAMALLPDWRLLVCGEGPDERRLRERASQRSPGRVSFLGWIPRPEVLRLMREEADVLLFPSLHEEGCWTAAEAVAAGLPVVCLDVGGPAFLASVAVRPGTPAETVRRLAAAVRVADTAPLITAEMQLGPRRSRLRELLVGAGLRVSAERIEHQ
ncbi:MAG: glycosyltransferase family 4 protein [Chloroflexota bacterium]|nr:glycosyltransferase family 4 protein [Chloroflexota bacterium]